MMLLAERMRPLQKKIVGNNCFKDKDHHVVAIFLTKGDFVGAQFPHCSRESYMLCKITMGALDSPNFSGFGVYLPWDGHWKLEIALGIYSRYNVQELVWL